MCVVFSFEGGGRGLSPSNLKLLIPKCTESMDHLPSKKWPHSKGKWLGKYCLQGAIWDDSSRRSFHDKKNCLFPHVTESPHFVGLSRVPEIFRKTQIPWAPKTYIHV